MELLSNVFSALLKTVMTLAAVMRGFFKFILIGLMLLSVYMLPTAVAMLRRKENTLSISILNFFLGWTLLGWVIALVWATKNDDAKTITVVMQQKAE